MDIYKLILAKINKNKRVKVSDIVKETGFSRAYINRFFQKLKQEGKISLIGKANMARYVSAKNKADLSAKRSILTARRYFKNKDVSEDLVFDEIEKNTGILFSLPKNVLSIVRYAFTEMLNNAIEHSISDKIRVTIKKDRGGVEFEVRDWGIGIFVNIMKKRKLKNELEAIQDLLKGKQTTVPKEHSGEGIFFTSKAAEKLVIRSSAKKLIFDNILNDVFIKDAARIKGTKVGFNISLDYRRNLNDIFRKYSGPAFEFSKTETKVSLYKINPEFISRSQARRIVSGLDKFNKIILDFKGVDTVGQAFADEIFRVWHKKNPKIEIGYRNANENIVFMIKRVVPK